jgi:hypothetical protein
MECAPVKPRLVEETVPDAQDVARIKGGANSRNEHQPRVGPAISGRSALEVLLVAMHPQRLNKRMRNAQRPPALGRLRRFEGQFAVNALQCLGHAERSGVQVNITPAEAKHLPFPQPHHQRDAKQRSKSVRRRDGQDLSSRILGEWLHLIRRLSGRIDQGRYVSR